MLVGCLLAGRVRVERGDQPRGGGRVVQQRGAALHGDGAEREPRAHVGHGRDTAAGDDRHVDGLEHLDQAAQRQRIDGRAAQPGGTPVGHRGGQRLPDDQRLGTGLDGGTRRLDDAHGVGAQLGQHRHAPGQLALDGGDRGADLEGLPGRHQLGLRAGVGRRDVDLDGADPGRGAEASRQLGQLAEAARGHRDHDPGPLLQQPGQLGGQEAVDAGVGQAGGVQQPRRGLQEPRHRPAPAGVEGDGAGGEGAQRLQRPVRRELAAGAAAAGGDEHRGGQSQPGEHGHDRAPARSSQRTRSPRSTGPSAQARAVRATPSSPTTGTGQP